MQFLIFCIFKWTLVVHESSLKWNMILILSYFHVNCTASFRSLPNTERGKITQHQSVCQTAKTVEPRCEKTGLWCFRPGPTQTRLYSHRRWLEALNFGLRKKRDFSIYVAKTKVLISCAVTAQLICIFVFAYAKIRFSHDAAQFMDMILYPLYARLAYDSTRVSPYCKAVMDSISLNFS